MTCGIRKMGTMEKEPQSALRELQRVMKNPRFLAAWAATFAIVALVGPFGSHETLGPVARYGYWALVISFSFMVSALTTSFFILNRRFDRISIWLRSLSGGVLIGACIGLFIAAINPSFWPDAPGLSGLVGYLQLTLPISLVVSLAITLSNRGQPQQAGPAEADAASVQVPASPFLRRLPVTIGKQLYSVSVQDHYVEAVTERGKHMVLMRFSDALDELAGIEGVRIHRSHWVAVDAIANTRKSGDRLFVILKDGRELPVSRSYLADVRETLRV